MGEKQPSCKGSILSSRVDCFVTNYSHLVNLKDRTVSPEVFTNPDIYLIEQEKIFRRCWIFVGHESQVREPGAFLTTTIGEEPVIVVKDHDGKVKVFFNSCRHRGVKVCRIDHGKAKVFQCPYHGWSYGIDGSLVGVPQQKTAYHGDLDKTQWGLIKVPRVESFHGLIFACLDDKAVSLEEYLGDIAWYIELILRRSKGGTKLLQGCHRWRVKGNWKLAAEQFAGDNYNADVLHKSLSLIGLAPSEFRGGIPWETDFQVKSSNGHGWINFKSPDGPLPPAVEEWIRHSREESKERLTATQAGLVHTTHVGGVFPNFAILSFMGFTFVRVWHPRGLNDLDVHSWALADEDAPDEVVAFLSTMLILNFSSSGIFEQDDVTVWGDMMSTLQGTVRRRFPLNYQMGAGHERRLSDRPGLIHPPSTEIGIFGFHEFWRSLMSR